MNTQPFETPFAENLRKLAKFEPGIFLVTAKANQAFEEAQEVSLKWAAQRASGQVVEPTWPYLLLAQHLSGDWGEVDSGSASINAAAMLEGGMIISRHSIRPTGVPVLIVTDAGRMETILMLASER